MGYPSQAQVFSAVKRLTWKDEYAYVRTNGLWHVLMFLRHVACNNKNDQQTFSAYDLSESVFDLNGVSLPVIQESRNVYYEPGSTGGNDVEKFFRHREGPRQTYLNRIYTGLTGAGPRQPKLFIASSNILPTTLSLANEWITVLRSSGDNQLILDERTQDFLTWIFRFGIPSKAGQSMHLAEHLGEGKMKMRSSVNCLPIPSDLANLKLEISKYFGISSDSLEKLLPKIDQVEPTLWIESVPVDPLTFGPQLFKYLNVALKPQTQGILVELIPTLYTACHEEVGFCVQLQTLTRFTSACLAKRFVIFTGLAGSGKTKLAQAFSRWITPAPDWIDPGDPSKGKQQNPCYALIPVGADWTGNENIVGYPDGLQPGNYITRPALELIRHACEPAHAGVPHFLILDEMNLSHVERYFADLLSAIESGEEIPLYEGDERTSDGKAVPKKLRLPDNLFVIGTVNVDETTYMFSPKVLDRANVIEFRMEPDEFESFLKSPKNPKLEELDGKGAAFGQAFVQAAADQGREVPASANNIFSNEILLFFNLLRDHNAEFGYRTGYEAARFVHFYQLLGGYQDDDMDWFNSAMDAVIVQKFLPKLHGSRSRLEGLLWALAWACGAERIPQDGKDFAAQLKEASSAMDEGKYGPEVLWNKFSLINPKDPAKVSHYPLSYDKVMRMWRKLVRDQFVNFAEA